MNDTILLCFDCGAYYKLPPEAERPEACELCGASLIDMDDLPTLQPVTVRESDGEGIDGSCQDENCTKG